MVHLGGMQTHSSHRPSRGSSADMFLAQNLSMSPRASGAEAPSERNATGRVDAASEGPMGLVS